MKFYYHKEGEDEKYFILDITLTEIKEYVLNKSFIKLIEEKIEELEFNTSYENLIINHEVEDYFK